MAKTRTLSAREDKILDRIELTLEDKGLSWADLARRVGKSVASGSQWSGRRVFPKEETLHRIAGVLEVGVGWLLTGDVPTEIETAQTVAEREALLLVREMSPEEQRAALAAMKGIVGSFKGTFNKK